MIEIVAGRPVEAERHVLRLRSLLAHQLDRKAPADMRRIEEGAVSAVVDVELVAAALLDAYQHARIFRAQRPARLAPELGRIADRQAFEGLVDHLDRKSVVSGKSVSVRGDLGGRRCFKKKKDKTNTT